MFLCYEMNESKEKDCQLSCIHANRVLHNIILLVKYGLFNSNTVLRIFALYELMQFMYKNSTQKLK